MAQSYHRIDQARLPGRYVRCEYSNDQPDLRLAEIRQFNVRHYPHHRSCSVIEDQLPPYGRGICPKLRLPEMAADQHDAVSTGPVLVELKKRAMSSCRAFCRHQAISSLLSGDLAPVRGVEHQGAEDQHIQRAWQQPNAFLHCFWRHLSVDVLLPE
ncbi:MAG: hypothetical protein LAQ69_10350 [Acidobacteriia bacterium]|nr:hypothetical protein [Terriglobia bacterium]